MSRAVKELHHSCVCISTRCWADPQPLSLTRASSRPTESACCGTGRVSVFWGPGRSWKVMECQIVPGCVVFLTPVSLSLCSSGHSEHWGGQNRSFILRRADAALPRCEWRDSCGPTASVLLLCINTTTVLEHGTIPQLGASKKMKESTFWFWSRFMTSNLKEKVLSLFLNGPPPPPPSPSPSPPPPGILRSVEINLDTVFEWSFLRVSVF